MSTSAAAAAAEAPQAQQAERKRQRRSENSFRSAPAPAIEVLSDDEWRTILTQMAGTVDSLWFELKPGDDEEGALRQAIKKADRVLSEAQAAEARVSEARKSIHPLTLRPASPRTLPFPPPRNC